MYLGALAEMIHIVVFLERRVLQNVTQDSCYLDTDCIKKIINVYIYFTVSSDCVLCFLTSLPI